MIKEEFVWIFALLLITVTALSWVMVMGVLEYNKLLIIIHVVTKFVYLASRVHARSV